jgi:hypothetical protein
MQSAVASAVGLPNRSTSARRMLVFVTPPDVSRSFVRGHEKVPTGGQVEVPAGGQIEVPTLRVVS